MSRKQKKKIKKNKITREKTLSLNNVYLTVFAFVFFCKNNAHWIRHDVDLSLVLLPVFNIGLLEWKEVIDIFNIMEVYQAR